MVAVGLLLLVAGLPLQALADSSLGEVLVFAGLLIALGSVVATEIWAWRHGDRFDRVDRRYAQPPKRRP